MNTRLAFAGLLAVLPLALSAQLVVTSLTAIGPNGSRGTAISPAGVVAGTMPVPFQSEHGFTYSGGVLTDLGTLHNGLAPTGINATGDLSIFVAGPSGSQAFRREASSLVSLGTLGGNTSYAFGINASGHIVGYADNASGQGRAFLHDGDSMADLGTLGGTTSIATAINDSGVVVGQARDASLRNRAFVYSGGVMTDLGTLGGTNSAANALNASGQIVGWAHNASGFERPFLHSGGVMTDLGTFGGNQGFASAINGAGWIVGYALTAADQEKAFLYQGGTMYDLETLAASFLSDGVTAPGFVSIDPMSSFGINDLGQIVGSGVYFDGVDFTDRALLITVSAIPEPSTYAMLAGLAALGLAAWRRKTKVLKYSQAESITSG